MTSLRTLRIPSIALAVLSLLPACGRKHHGDGPERPTVTSVIPVDGGSSVALNTDVSALFSTDMDAASITDATFRVTQGATAVPGAVVYDAGTKSAIFSPDSALAISTVYTGTITTGVRDSGSLALSSNFTWTFTTAANSAPPMVLSTAPLNSALDISISRRPTATFDKAMDPATLNAGTFTLKKGATPIAGTVTLDGLTNTARFTPSSPLELSTFYTATITNGVKDTGHNAMVADYVWSFTTGACSLASVDLRTAGAFAVLAGSTVTNTGNTSVTGDLGVSPGNAITGFGPGMVVGAKHAGDPTAAQGIADLTVAYNDAAGRSLCPVTVAGNLGGQTLAPGLYKSTSSLAISSGDLTLDASGDGDAIWIFQTASTLTTTAGRQVILTNGAQAGNVYWQVGSSATLGTTSAFKGTIMADQAITLTTGATLDQGRALARIGAVTLDSNTVVKPAP